MPEGLFDHNELNIRNLTVEEPSPENNLKLPFDPERDINPAIWRLLELRFNELSPWTGSEILGRIKLLSPERLPSLIYPTDKLQEIKAAAEEHYEPMPPIEAGSETYFDSRVLFPDLIPRTFYEDGWDAYGSFLEDVEAHRSVEAFFGHTGFLSLFFPEQATRLKSHIEKAWPFGMEWIEKAPDFTGQNLQFLAFIDEFLQVLVGMRLTAPEQWPRLKRDIDEVQWTRFKRFLSQKEDQVLRQAQLEPAQFQAAITQWSRTARTMRLLEAPIIKMTPEGLILEEPVKKPDAIPDLPEQRKY